jgi:hypothetical protein
MVTQSQFDPELVPDLFKGDFTNVVVDDPAIAGHVPNLVIDPSHPFAIHVSWRLVGTQVPLYMAALDNEWVVTAYAESIGPGPELKLATGNEPKTNATITAQGNVPVYEWTHTLQVPAGLLQEENPGGNPSGTYLTVVTAFLNSNLGSPGFDIIGFNQGPMLKVEDPT